MLTSIESALTQLATACSGAGWRSSISTAQSYQEALEYLLVNRPKRGEDAGSTLDYDSLQTQLSTVATWLTNRNGGSGRSGSRRVAARFCEGGIQ